jgi:hypothetical protein
MKSLTTEEQTEIVHQALIASYNTERARPSQIYLEDADPVWLARAKTVVGALAGEQKRLDQFYLK